MDTPKDPRSGAVALGGAALIAFGAWWLVRETGIIPQATLDLINRSAGAVTLIGLGVIVLLLSRRGTFSAPRSGTRLYRSRNDRVLGGVLGGLGAYLGIDPLLLRIAVGLLTLLGNGGLVAIYIVMWIVVPEEPLGAVPGAYAPPAPPAAPAPPAPPASGV